MASLKDNNQDISFFLEAKTSADVRKAIFKLALPAMLEFGLMMLVQMIDMIQVGSLGPWAIAATGLAAQPTMLIFSVFSALVVGTTALVARAAGAGNRDYACRVTRQSFIIVLIMGIIVTAIGIPASGFIIKLMGADVDTLEPGTIYMKIIIAGTVFTVGNMVLAASLRGVGDMITPMISNIVANIINIFMNWVLINGKLGFPRLEVAGAAIATSFSRLVAFAITLHAVYSRDKYIHISIHDSYRFEPDIIKSVLNIGIPAAIEQLIMRGGALLFARLIAGFGTIMFAAHQIAINIDGLGIVPAMAFQMAATTLVGQGIGAQKPELSEEAARQSTIISTIMMSLIGVIYFFLGQYAIGIFTKDAQVIALGKNALKILAFSQPFTAIYFVIAGALRGAGDTKYAMYASAIGMWGIRLGIGYILADLLNMALAGAWIAVTIDMAVRMILVLKRFSSGVFKEYSKENL
ncbi:putative MATE family efflux protein [Keratinibaculum paraultunense]|uniref:Probable multidrug resistance protein NorM n=1 Tax=Keratinibaculum paraultunense TaxID=1278232 RepID=A0A4R3KXU0_9FIRM|nr:MATE family efflux transporter [Keratinibaculum paraultunense]QQY80230.1 MATE family efflux transporter [Keratinibaculum paraultunense]TCS90742.1 putative MATE family efflux protein [Keratinibaculum paraultunense]